MAQEARRDPLADLDRLAAPALRSPYAPGPVPEARPGPIANAPLPALPPGAAGPPPAAASAPPAAPSAPAPATLEIATPDIAPVAPTPAPPAPATAEVEVRPGPRPMDGGPVVEVIWLGEGPPPDLLPFIEAPESARVVMAEPGPVVRRDPIEPPLLEQGEWREWLLSVVLNGELVSDGALFIRNRDDQWAVQVLDLRVWRVRLDNDRIITFNGEAFYPLDALPDLEQRYDEATLTIELDLPPDSFEPSTLQARRPTNLAAVAGRGGFLDYDLLFVTGDELRTRLDALLELGLFDQIGVLISGFRAGDVANGERDFARLDTTFTRDFPGRRASLRLGDSLTEAGALGRPVRFGGLQWSTDFSTDPTFVTFPLPTIGGLASQPSVAEVFLNNTRRVTEHVPPGPFAIEDLPALTGAGELQLKVTDLLGREQLVTQSYYVSSRLLRPGLSEYSYEVGFEREKFNQASFDYGRPLAAATHRYGITDGLTGEGRIELSERQQNLGGGGSVLLGTFGLVSGGVVGSGHRSAPGFAAFADYEYRANKAMRASLDGALAYVDGHAGLTRQLGRAFGIVDLPGYPDVTVFVENREVGRTNGSGQLFLPRLNPYQENRVRIRAEDLPLTAQIDVEEKIAVPFDRSGVGVTFEVRDNRTALATLLGPDGEPLPAGLAMTGDDGRLSAQVADRGFAYITSAGGAAAELHSVPGQPAFRCALPDIPDEPMAQLGEIRCE